METFNYELDDEPQMTTEREMTPVQILTKGEIDPAKNYLVQIEGEKQVSYKDTPEVPIHMHNKMEFISVSIKPTEVS